MNHLELFKQACDSMWKYLLARGWEKQEDGYCRLRKAGQVISDKTLQEAFAIQSGADFGK